MRWAMCSFSPLEPVSCRKRSPFLHLQSTGLGREPLDVALCFQQCSSNGPAESNDGLSLAGDDCRSAEFAVGQLLPWECPDAEGHRAGRMDAGGYAEAICNGLYGLRPVATGAYLGWCEMAITCPVFRRSGGAEGRSITTEDDRSEEKRQNFNQVVFLVFTCCCLM